MDGTPQTRGFLFADLRGYSAFADQHGDLAARDLLRRFRTAVREVIGGFGGAEIRTEGDSFYVVFGSVSSAVRAALAILSAVQAPADLPASHPIQVGIGIHAGETEDSEDGIVSSAVNVAARICALAGPGEVLVSDTVRALTKTYLDVTFVPRGRRHLKGIAEPIRLFRAQATTIGSRVPAIGLRRLIEQIRRPALICGIGGAVIVTTALVGAAIVREGLGGIGPRATPSPPPPSSSSVPAEVATIVLPTPDPMDAIPPVLLEAGAYRFANLDPDFTFRVPTGDWYAYRDYLDAAGVYLLKAGADIPPSDTEYVGGLDFGRIQVVFATPCRDSDTTLIGSTPNALVEWLQQHEFLDASDAVPVNLAGYSGLQVDVTILSDGETDPCPQDEVPVPVVFLFPVGEDVYHLLPGERLRVITLDMAGRPFSILLWSTEQQFDAFVERAAPILESLRPS